MCSWYAQQRTPTKAQYFPEIHAFGGSERGLYLTECTQSTLRVGLRRCRRSHAPRRFVRGPASIHQPA